MINEKVDPFVTQYRDALERQRDLSNQNLDNTRRNDFASIMGNANSAGMMYSNFPERSKIQYDTKSYMPSQVNIQNTYQTGLDKLRNNVVNLSNQLKNINDAIADLNKTGVKKKSSDKTNDGYNSWDFGDGYAIYGKKGGQAIYSKDGKEISAGEFLEGTKGKINWDNWNKIWSKGINTIGVGSDTINDYYNNNIDKSGRHGYLY